MEEVYIYDEFCKNVEGFDNKGRATKIWCGIIGNGRASGRRESQSCRSIHLDRPRRRLLVADRRRRATGIRCLLSISNC